MEPREAQPAEIRGEISDPEGLVRAAGALDVASLPALKDELMRMLRLGQSRVIVDLTDVDRVDPAALALLGLTREVRMRDGELVLVDPHADRAAALEGHGFQVRPTLAEARRERLPAPDA